MEKAYWPGFEKWWEAYPEKGQNNKPAAFQQWRKTVKILTPRYESREEANDYLIDLAKGYAVCSRVNDPDENGKTYCLSAANWLREHYDDNPLSWGGLCKAKIRQVAVAPVRSPPEKQAPLTPEERAEWDAAYNKAKQDIAKAKRTQ